MYAIFVALPLAIAFVPFIGGSLHNVVWARWESIWMILVSAFAPIPLSIWLGPSDRGTWLPFSVTIAAFGLSVAWCYRNRHHGWPTASIAAGTLLNMLVIAANLGTMPVDLPTGDTFETHLYRAELAGDRLLGLHDWIAVPGGNYLSPGDILVMVGFVALVVTAARKPKRAPELQGRVTAET